MKKWVIKVALSDAAAAALEYGTGLPEQFVEDALVTHLEGDCRDTDWGEDVARLFGFHEEDVSDALRVTDARIVDMDGEAGT